MLSTSLRCAVAGLCLLTLAACKEGEVSVAGSTAAASSAASPADGGADMSVAEEVAVFPAAFRGNWDYNEDGCDKVESSTRFVISENKVSGYEDTSTLRSLEVLDDLSIRVGLDNESSDGHLHLTQIMRLSPVAGISLRITDGDKTIRALRCDPV